MAKQFIPLSKSTYNKAISKYVDEALINNEISLHGKNIDELESELKKYLNTYKELVVLNSGTAAIHLALIQLGVTHGDEVLCQSFTFCASANPIIYQGATPVFIDSEEHTWNMCPNHLEDAIKDRMSKGKKPKAIIAVHLYGMPAKIDEIMQIANNYEIPVIEDAAEALGSSYNKQKCGTFGDFAILSFNGNKIITTSGGGAIVCNSQEAKKRTIFLATQARDDAPHYEHSEIGYNYRMSNIVAGVGRGQMEVLEKHITLRREMHMFYKDIFRDVEGVKVFEEPTDAYFSNHWLSCITIDSNCKFTRDQLQKVMQTKNIESRPLWKPMHLQPVFKNTPYYGNGVSENLFSKGLCLPSGSNLTNDDRNRISNCLNAFLS